MSFLVKLPVKLRCCQASTSVIDIKIWRSSFYACGRARHHLWFYSSKTILSLCGIRHHQYHKHYVCNEHLGHEKMGPKLTWLFPRLEPGPTILLTLILLVSVLLHLPWKTCCLTPPPHFEIFFCTMHFLKFKIIVSWFFFVLFFGCDYILWCLCVLKFVHAIAAVAFGRSRYIRI